ncbi:hypothetical protein [Dictyobacter aurantiacus]|uniref:Uncharacterized protein n=1 Tax=Dictyobacter aurantiacus TaxID=1936993 RepID=A0A401ZD04_9CHLR|nr:hypothetical protein [Dictyobacter aurantiacus]GCE04770.1 hypothetical protein KDAU_20990 [Dictyobacter aurantiacus]
MTTLIAVYNSQGCVGRCDARCYEAVTPICTCICGGRNHGAGRDKSIENTRELAQQWIAAYTQEHQLGKVSTEIHEECQQPTLWSSVT